MHDIFSKHSMYLFTKNNISCLIPIIEGLLSLGIDGFVCEMSEKFNLLYNLGQSSLL